METEKLKEQARKNAFRSNNGAVIRAVNIIRTDYVQLDMVLAALTPKIGKAEIMDGINYLCRHYSDTPHRWLTGISTPPAYIDNIS